MWQHVVKLRVCCLLCRLQSGQVIRYFFNNSAYTVAFHALKKEAEDSPRRLYLCTRQKEECPPGVATYIPTKAEVSSGRWKLYKKRKQKSPPDVGIYKRNENKRFLRTLAKIYQTKGGVSSGRWHIYTNKSGSFLRALGTL